LFISDPFSFSVRIDPVTRQLPNGMITNFGFLRLGLLFVSIVRTDPFPTRFRTDPFPTRFRTDPFPTRFRTDPFPTGFRPVSRRCDSNDENSGSDLNAKRPERPRIPI
jgi:hypothetical protein